MDLLSKVGKQLGKQTVPTVPRASPLVSVEASEKHTACGKHEAKGILTMNASWAKPTLLVEKMQAS